MDPIMMTADVVAATLFISSQVLMRLQAARALPKKTNITYWQRERFFAPTKPDTNPRLESEVADAQLAQ